MGRKKRKPGAFSPETRELVMTAIARKAAAGNMTAARIYLDEYRASNAGNVDEINANILSLAELINAPDPDRFIMDIPDNLDDQPDQ